MADLPQDELCPDAVLRLQAPTEGFLCPLSANTYGIEFHQFDIKDYDSGTVIFHVQRDLPSAPAAASAPPPSGTGCPLDPDVEAALRTIRYKFPSSFLRINTIRTSLVFKVGPQEVPNFRMIERHYFRDRLIRSYDFTFGFCIPNSINTWDAIYPMPALSESEIAEMTANPWQAKSDSFYFVNDKLVMHNKAEFAYEVR